MNKMDEQTMLSRGVTVSASAVMNEVNGTEVSLWVYSERERESGREGWTKKR